MFSDLETTSKLTNTDVLCSVHDFLSDPHHTRNLQESKKPFLYYIRDKKTKWRKVKEMNQLANVDIWALIYLKYWSCPDFYAFTFMAVFPSRFPEGGSATMVKLSGSSRSRIFDSFISVSSFFFATFSTCFMLTEVWHHKQRQWRLIIGSTGENHWRVKCPMM